MTITPRLNDALAALRQASAPQAASERPAAAAAAAAAAMAPVALTPLEPPRADMPASEAAAPSDDALPGAVPTARRELFDRHREDLLALLATRDFGELPPSWAAISGRISQEEAASAAAALQLIAARVSP